MLKRCSALALLLALLLTGCAARSNKLLDGASPSTSALALYEYDGETVTRRFLFDQTQEMKLLAALDRVPISEDPDWLPTQATAPIYAIEIGGTDGFERYGAWSDGHWIMSSGEVFRFDFDFAALQDDYDWDAESVNTFDFFTVLPCSRAMTLGAAGWNTALLDEASPLDPPEDITIALQSEQDNILTVAFTNHAASGEWCFGEYFSVEVLLGGVWYVVPSVQPLMFNDIAYVLSAGQTITNTYSISAYGELPAGQYRLRTHELVVEFTR